MVPSECPLLYSLVRVVHAGEKAPSQIKAAHLPFSLQVEMAPFPDESSPPPIFLAGAASLSSADHKLELQLVAQSVFLPATHTGEASGHRHAPPSQ